LPFRTLFFHEGEEKQIQLRLSWGGGGGGVVIIDERRTEGILSSILLYVSILNKVRDDYAVRNGITNIGRQSLSGLGKTLQFYSGLQ